MSIVAWLLLILGYCASWVIFTLVLLLFEEFVENWTGKKFAALDAFCRVFIDWDPTKIILVLAILLLPLTMVCAYGFAGLKLIVPKLVSFLPTPFKGAVGMKWFLFRSLFLVAFGFTASETQLVNRAYQWWNAPPALPSAEAQKLIASLERAEGWRSYQSSSGHSCVKKYDTTVATGDWWATVWAGGVECNGQFSFRDLKAINDAAATCLRKLATRSMEETVADSR